MFFSNLPFKDVIQVNCCDVTSNDQPALKIHAKLGVRLSGIAGMKNVLTPSAMVELLAGTVCSIMGLQICAV